MLALKQQQQKQQFDSPMENKRKKTYIVTTYQTAYTHTNGKLLFNHLPHTMTGRLSVRGSMVSVDMHVYIHIFGRLVLHIDHE